MGQMLKLFHWEPNANSGKPILALKEKGVEFESHYVDLLKFDQHTPEYLKINPAGQVPAMYHDDLVLTESTAIMEYVDEAFEGPPLRPENPYERWRMRWQCKYLDEYFGPSLSMIGWSMFMGPMVRDRDPEELKAAIERIPVKERRIAWSTAIYNTFTEEQLSESRRRVANGIRQMEEALSAHTWFAGESYSLADIDAFNMAYALPVGQPELVNDDQTPHLMDWLRKVYDRPAVRATFAMGKTELADRARQLLR